jgi:hypothetical protein
VNRKYYLKFIVGFENKHCVHEEQCVIYRGATEVRLKLSLKVKVKVKLSLCLTKHHAMKTYRGSGGIAPYILDLVLDGGEWSASRPGRFTPRERSPSTHWIGGWMGPRVALDTVVKRKIPSSLRESNPRTQIVQPIA